MVFAQSVKNNDEDIPREPSGSFFNPWQFTCILYREKNRENHDIIYFHDQTKGEEDEKARKFFLENVARLYFDCCSYIFLLAASAHSFT